MKAKRIFALLLAAAIALSMCGCTAKLTTVRPRDVYVKLERLEDGVITGMPDSAELSEKAEALVLQLEAPYNASKDCGGGKTHIYHVTLVRVFSGETEMECFINADGSVCKNGTLYVPFEDAVHPVNVADWDDYFEAMCAAQPQ